MLEKTSIIHPETRLGPVSLTVANLDRQIAFYQDVLGFTTRWRKGAVASLGTGSAELLRLNEIPGARRVQGTTGLYHFAILYPSQRELARAIARLFARRYPNAPTDHVVSKSTYLDDLEGNNIELYIRTLDDGSMKMVNGRMVVLHADGRPSDGREALDVDTLLRELTPEDPLDLPLPEGTILGHVHLYARSLTDSLHFYHEVLGFQAGLLATSFRMGDVGLSEERPHVIAFNTWKGEGALPPPPDTLGMRYFTIELPDAAELERVLVRVKQAGLVSEPIEPGILVRDPAQIGVMLTAGSKEYTP